MTIGGHDLVPHGPSIEEDLETLRRMVLLAGPDTPFVGCDLSCCRGGNGTP